MNTKEIKDLFDLEDPKWGADTGLKDKDGETIQCGDILEFEYNEFYGLVTAIVHWRPDFGAYVRSGKFEGGGGFCSLNAECFKDCKIIGSINETPELFRISSKE